MTTSFESTSGSRPKYFPHSQLKGAAWACLIGHSVYAVWLERQPAEGQVLTSGLRQKGSIVAEGRALSTFVEKRGQ